MTQRPELQKDANDLWPGQRHPLDVPAFLLDLRGDAATNPIVVSPATDPPETAPSWAPPWQK